MLKFSSKYLSEGERQATYKSGIDSRYDTLEKANASTYHERVRISAETLLQELCKLGFTIGNDVLACVLSLRLALGQSGDDFAEDVERLVDVNTLFCLLSSRASQALLL